jgi:uncharacterized membrane protein
MGNQTVNEGKTNAIISYLTIIGTLVAFVLNNSKKNPFANFHIRQNIGLNALYFINQYIIYKHVSWIIGAIVGVVIFVLWIIGLLGVLKGEQKMVPIFGEQFQDWFKGI